MKTACGSLVAVLVLCQLDSAG